MAGLKAKLKRILIITLCVSSVLTSIYSAIPVAYAAGSSGILGTNKALGSPILNSKVELFISSFFHGCYLSCPTGGGYSEKFFCLDGSLFRRSAYILAHHRFWGGRDNPSYFR